jgi:hypothetical protein
MRARVALVFLAVEKGTGDGEGGLLTAAFLAPHVIAAPVLGMHTSPMSSPFGRVGESAEACRTERWGRMKGDPISTPRPMRPEVPAFAGMTVLYYGTIG